MATRIGPAGWSYEDWKGIVYPKDATSKFDQLSYLAEYFDTIEINSTFYRPATNSIAKSWAVRFAQDVMAVLQAVLGLRDQKPKLSPEAFAGQAAKLEQQLDALIDEKRRLTDSDNRRMAKRQE